MKNKDFILALLSLFNIVASFAVMYNHPITGFIFFCLTVLSLSINFHEESDK